MGIRSYSPTDVDILLGGFYKVTGFVTDSFITITKDVQPYKTTRTADGRSARTYIRDDTYTITLTLASTSPSNDILQKLHQADILTQLGKFPLFVKDNLGSTLFLSPTTWVKQVPDTEFSSGVTDRVWVLQSTQAAYNIGGNEDASSELDDLVNTITGSIPSLKSILG